MKRFYFLVICMILFFCVLSQIASAQDYTFEDGTPGAKKWVPRPGTTRYRVIIWGGGGAGSLSKGGGGSAVSVSNYFYLNVATPDSIAYSVGYGGEQPGNSSSDGTNSVFVIPGASSFLSGYGKSNGTSVVYAPNAIIASSFSGGSGGSGGWVNPCFFGGGGGGSAWQDWFGVDGGTGECVNYGGNGAGVGGTGSANQLPGTDGENPGGGGGGAVYLVAGGKGGNGKVMVECFCEGGGGTIAAPYTVPYPRENAVDSIISVTGADGYSHNIEYYWEYKTTEGGQWEMAPGINNQPNYQIPSNDAVGWYYRRAAANVCDTYVKYSNEVKLTVLSINNIVLGLPSKNGTINGYVKSRTGSGVPGIKVYAQKMVSLKGSSQSHIDSAITNGTGLYTFSNLFYGDYREPTNDPTVVSFRIWPFKQGHGFDTIQGPLTTLSYSNPVISADAGPQFKDTTAFSVNGRVFQKCTGCLNSSNVTTNTETSGVDSTKVTGTDLPVYTLTDGSGLYTGVVAEQGIKTLVPSYQNHRYFPASITQNINDNVSGLNFEDTTTFNISGRLTAGGGDAIGIATLEFADTTTGRTGSAFRKRVTTDANGFYNINLPARKYRVKLINFTPGFPSNNPRYISLADITTYFNQLLPKDSLYRDIDIASTTLNLVYHRKPVIQITGLVDTACNTTAGVIFKQNKKKPFTVNVFEGDPVIGFKVVTLDNVQAADSLSKGDSIKIITNLRDKTGNSPNETIYFRLTQGKVDTSIIAGVPNILAPYNRLLNFSYTDRYGRPAVDVSVKATTVGILSPPQTFVTTAPQMPQVILHRPPGDQSYSFWEQSKTIETSQTLSISSGESTTGFFEVMAGAEFSAGIGVEIQTSVEASINTSIGTTFTNANENEIVVSSTTTTNYSTKAGGIVGSDGDVYIGGALNYKYGISNVLALKDTIGACPLELSDQLIVAPSGYATTFTYSEDHIKNTLMPALEYFVNNTSGSQQAYYQNQLNVWEQVVSNNELQKANAVFVANRSFDGSTGGVAVSETLSQTNTSTISFNLEISREVATTLGASVNGNGVAGGVTVGMMLESGASKSGSTNNTTTTGYFLGDDNPGDYYSVDIKNDPVYGTPVFDLVAGTSSCPPEPAAQSRDFPVVVIDTPVYNNIANNAERFIKIKVANLSQSRETRNYHLNINNSTSNGLVISVNGITLGSTIYWPVDNLAWGETREIDVSVRKFNPASTIYSWPDVEFTLTDDCTGDVQAGNFATFNFVAPCGSIVLDEPVDDFISNATGSNYIPIAFSGYTLASIDSVKLQYAKAGSATWLTGFVQTRGQLNPSSTTYPWNIQPLSDSIYKIRMVAYCNSGIPVYTPSVTGVIDRRAPSLIGRPQPADNNYVNGDEISFSYNENLSTAALENSNAIMKHLPGNTVIPVAVSGYGNKITIVPLSDITAFNSDTMELVVQGATDIYGNTSNKQDTIKFTIGTTVPAPGVPAVKLFSVLPEVFEDSSRTMEIHFKLPAPARRLLKVYYNVSGAATFNTDYTIITDTLTRMVKDNQSNQFVPVDVISSFNGNSGYIYIDSLAREAVLKVKPIADKISESNESISVKLLSGGDYTLTDSTFTTVTIKNDDADKPVLSGNPGFAACTTDSITLTASVPENKRWAARVINFSSQFSATDRSANQLLGLPDVYPSYGDNVAAWAGSQADNSREFVEIGFDNPSPANFIDIYQTYKPGAIDTVYLKNAVTGMFVRVYTRTAAAEADSARRLRISFPTTAYNVSEIRIALNSGTVPGRNQIDAVAIGETTNYVSYRWTPGNATTASIRVGSSGQYFVAVTDNRGFKINSDTVTVTIGVPATVSAGISIPGVCPGGNSALLAGSFGGGASGAVWSDGGAGGTFTNNIGSTPEQAVYHPAAGANGNVTLTLAASGNGCSAIANKVIVVNGQSTWRGITNDWNTESNWSLGKVPMECTNVIIPPGVSHMPVVTGVNNSCKSLRAQPASVITIGSGAKLTVTGP